MSRARAPMAQRMPISRVRSVTETSMMFMIPMPPTRREIEAMAPSMSDIVRVVSAAVLTRAVRLRTLKSLSAPSARRWRWRKSCVMSRSATGMASADPARTTMKRTLP